MSEPQLQFHFRDSDSRGAADELAQFLANELPDWQPRVEEQVLSAEGRKADPIAIIALVLSIPPAIQSSWDLAQRIKLKEKIDKLIAWAKDRSARGKVNPSVLLPPEGKAVPLDQAASQQILDAVAAQASVHRNGT
jgi:hypothetical protein